MSPVRFAHPALRAGIVAAAIVFAAGCGEEVEPVSGADAPAITSPGTTIPYEAGGGDGSGSDGSDDETDRGGVAAGPDSVEPGSRAPAGQEPAPSGALGAD